MVDTKAKITIKDIAMLKDSVAEVEEGIQGKRKVKEEGVLLSVIADVGTSSLARCYL